MRDLEQFCASRLEDWRDAGLERVPHQVSERLPGGRLRQGDGRLMQDFASSDYLGLATDPSLRADYVSALARYGAGSVASRCVSGTLSVHAALEAELAHWLGREACVLFASAYMANVGVFSALLGPEDAIFSDALNHASLIDGMRLSRAQRYRYAHADTAQLERSLSQHRGVHRHALIVTESVFSMDGDAPELDALEALAERYDATLLIDEAHALGVCGVKGAGVAAGRSGTVSRETIVVGGLGKAFAAQGGLVAGPACVVDWLRQSARSYVYTTAPSPGLVAGLSAALARVRDADAARETLQARVRQLREALGVSPAGPGAIVPVRVGSLDALRGARDALDAAGYWVGAMRPPTVPEGTARLRCVLSAAHSVDQVSSLAEVLLEALALRAP